MINKKKLIIPYIIAEIPTNPRVEVPDLIMLQKALGKKRDNLTILDGTAGCLSDTLIFLALGHKVIACEQSRVLFMLLNDAINRAREELIFLKENLLFVISRLRIRIR